MGTYVGPRPETSTLTAHRLVAGALGVSSKVDEEKANSEKAKLAAAKGKHFLHAGWLIPCWLCHSLCPACVEAAAMSNP